MGHWDLKRPRSGARRAPPVSQTHKTPRYGEGVSGSAGPDFGDDRLVLLGPEHALQNFQRKRCWRVTVQVLLVALAAFAWDSLRFGALSV